MISLLYNLKVGFIEAENRMVVTRSWRRGKSLINGYQITVRSKKSWCWAQYIAQVAKCIPSKHQALSSNPSTTKKTKPKLVCCYCTAGDFNNMYNIFQKVERKGFERFHHQEMMYV
jgi:pentatricopeptide repeat protein